MNVMNRKMFTNRDARRKLANMGGIIASSPELLNTAQSFAPGGQTNVEQYVAYIPNINGGRPVRLTAETLSRLQSLAPDLMQQSIVLDQATAAEQGFDVMRLRPGDAFVERQLKEKQAPPSSIKESVTQPSIRDIENPMIKLVESGLTAAGVEDPNARLSLPSLVTPDNENPMVKLIESGIASLQTEDGSPIEAQYPELPIRGENTDASRRVAEIIAENRTDLPGVNLPGPSTTYEIDPNAAIKAGQSLSVADQMLGLGFTGGDIDPSALTSESDMGLTSITGGDGEEYFVSPAGSVFKKENGQLKSVSGGEAMQVVDIAQRQGEDFSKSPIGVLPLGTRDVDDRTGMVIPDTFEELSIPIGDLRTPEILTNIFSGDKDKETLDEQVEAAQKPPTKEELPTKSQETAEAAAEAAREASLDQPDQTTEKELADIKKNVDEENEKGGDPVGAASSGLLASAGVDTSNMSRKERVESMKSMLSDLLGYDDQDQKEEFWLTMASIGFGIAAGQDSNALTNIAQGLAEGSSKFIENKATRQAREDKLTLTALGEVLADERATTKFGRDMQIAAIRAAKSGVGTQEPFVDAVRVLAQKGLDSGMYETIEESLAAADAALRPYYTSTTATGDQAEETVQVVQDGQTITVKKSELPTQKKVLTKEG
jgi:hypothetical protein